jgi:hypothetical protein
MTPLLKNLPPLQVMDKNELAHAFDRYFAEMGIEFDAEATPEKAQEMMLEARVRPEDNILSQDLLRSRYPEDHEDSDDE